MLIALISFAAYILAGYLGSMALELCLLTFIPDNENIMLLYQIGSWLITLLVAFPIFLAIHKASAVKVKALFTRNKRIPPRSLILYTVLALAAAIAPVVVIKAFVPNMPFALPDLITGVWMVLITPVIEEIVFRGFILQKLMKYGAATAILITTILFSVGHLNIGNMIISFLPGIVLAIIAVKTETIAYTVPLHMLINLCGGVVLSLVLAM